VIRGFVVSLAAFLAVILGHKFADGDVETIINFVVTLFSLLAALWIRPAVVPNNKVIVYDDTPLATVSTIKPGDAVAAPTDMHAVEKAAKTSGKAA
jgi:hypothetical protein